jgi:drug/metabolite transporter (DMT)-like permease
VAGLGRGGGDARGAGVAGASLSIPSLPSVQIFLRAAPLTFALLWSSGFIVAKYAAADADPFTFLAARFGASIVILTLIALASRAPWPSSARQAAHSMVAGILLHGGYLAGIWWAVAQGLPAGIAGLITAGQPLLTALLAVPLLNERVTRRQWYGIAVGLVGIVLVLAPRLAAVDVAGLGGAVWPILASIAATVSVTLGTLYQKRFVSTADLRTGTCLQFIGALAFVAPLALATETLRFEVTSTLLAALAWSVLVVSIAAIALLLFLIRQGEVSRIAALIYLVPPLTALEAFVLFGERLTVIQIAGMAVTAAGVWLAVRR